MKKILKGFKFIPKEYWRKMVFVLFIEGTIIFFLFIRASSWWGSLIISFIFSILSIFGFTIALLICAVYPSKQSTTDPHSCDGFYVSLGCVKKIIKEFDELVNKQINDKKLTMKEKHMAIKWSTVARNMINNRVMFYGVKEPCGYRNT